jgi:propanol-preferring alcohol dehydrogenase
VLGAGGLGAFAVQFFRILTAARVIAVDANPDRLGYAASIGAHDSLASVADVRGADAVVDFVGTDETIAAGLAAVRPGGAYGLVGAAGGRLERAWFGTLPRDGEVYTFQGGTIADVQEVLGLAATGQIRNDVEEFGFDRIDEAYSRLVAGTLSGRAVVVLES